MQRIYFFGGGSADGGKDQKDLLGGKGANLAEMARLGLPVPPGFTVSTEVCSEYFAEGGRVPPGLLAELPAAVARLEEAAGARFDDPVAPLLVSVRSGARASMPGMMDTILDLGLNGRTVKALAKASGDRRFAWDSYRRFCSMFGTVVLGMPGELFAGQLLLQRQASCAASDAELSASDFEQLVADFRGLVHRETGQEIPTDPREQLVAAIAAVFRSWDNPRAVTYRKLHGIPASWGTAVTVQRMVFGNLGNDSGSGVAFSRNPATGEPGLYGEFLPSAQGEDVVAGIRTPMKIAELERRLPAAYKALLAASDKLERHYGDLQDIEFTVERGRLFMLQCRAGKRSSFASVRVAVDLANEGRITREQAVLLVPPKALDEVLRPVFDETARASAAAEGRVLGRGLPAGPGAATGRIALDAVDAEAARARGEAVILVRRETSAEDLRGMIAADGLLTASGGMTSHAALVARQMGKIAVVGCATLTIDEGAGTCVFATPSGPRTLRAGDFISLDGFAGEVIEGALGTRPSEVIEALVRNREGSARSPLVQHFVELLGWADAIRRLGVRANADQPDQAALAVAFGAEGVGLCRTEHMFFGPGKIEPMREMILALTEPERKAALAKLLPLQRADFAALFRTLAGRHITIRLLDPPLNEFLPRDESGVAALARQSGLEPDEVWSRVAALRESNPMLGLRGCRLGIARPEITAMQARAIFEAACEVSEEGVEVAPEIMVPLVGDRRELDHQAKVIHAAAQAVFAERVRRVPYRVGTMIEVPRAAVMAGDIAGSAEFFSFGTNDLTQMTYALSRDDAGEVLQHYLDAGIFESDPFVTLDADGVGALMRMAVERGRKTRPALTVGICGEHGGDPASVALCDSLGLDYVSCSPSRVPVARLAAAQAALRRS